MKLSIEVTKQAYLLTMLNDGVDGVDLGVIGPHQYALNYGGNVMRRRASEKGTYGGWRWECSAAHLQQYPVLYRDLNDRISRRVSK